VVVGVVAGLRRRPAGAPVSPRALVAAMLATALVLVVLSLGPYAQLLGRRPLAWLWDAVPGLRFFRIPLRFSFLVSLPVAVLGGLAAATIARAAEARAGRAGAWLATAALLCGACWQGARPIPLSRFHPDGQTPPLYEWIARQPCDPGRCAVLEVPVGPAWDEDPTAVFWTLAHGHPGVNGYSGFAPAAYPQVASLAGQLPEAAARATLASLTGARWVVVHRARLTPEERTAWDAAALPEAARFGDDVVYELPVTDVDWRAAYVTPPRDATYAGTPLAPLPAGSRAELRLADGLTVEKRGTLSVAAEVRNAGDTSWPALTSRSHDRVSLALTWIGPRGPVPNLPVTSVLLPVDLAPGRGVRVAARLRAPGVPGTYTVEARVVQEGRGPLRGRPAPASGSLPESPAGTCYTRTAHAKTPPGPAAGAGPARRLRAGRRRPGAAERHPDLDRHPPRRPPVRLRLPSADEPEHRPARARGDAVHARVRLVVVDDPVPHDDVHLAAALAARRGRRRQAARPGQDHAGATLP
jgi:hypothetical protein